MIEKKKIKKCLCINFYAQFFAKIKNSARAPTSRAAKKMHTHDAKINNWRWCLPYKSHSIMVTVRTYFLSFLQYGWSSMVTCSYPPLYSHPRETIRKIARFNRHNITTTEENGNIPYNVHTSLLHLNNILNAPALPWLIVQNRQRSLLPTISCHYVDPLLS